MSQALERIFLVQEMGLNRVPRLRLAAALQMTISTFGAVV
jgi:hypothetical protein